MTPRRKTTQIRLGQLKVGGDAAITVQSMTKTDTRDVQATLLDGRFDAFEAGVVVHHDQCSNRYQSGSHGRPERGRPGLHNDVWVVVWKRWRK